jgi:hypothetical protein
MSQSAPITAADLRPGDVLLMLGHGEISKLLAWNGGSEYSHAAVVVDDGDLVEAATVGLRRVSLKERLADTAEVVLMDAYRPSRRDGKPFVAPDEEIVSATARSFIGRPYATQFLTELAIVVTVRGHLPKHEIGRLLVRLALDHHIANVDTSMTCCELVFRAFHDAPVAPANALTPRIFVQPRDPLPMPKIDWIALWKEWQQMRRRASSGPAAKRTNGADAITSEHIDAVPAIGDGELTARIERVRALLAHAPGLEKTLALADGKPIEDPRPNPKTIIPLDLQSSPSVRLLGRLMG